MRTGRPLAAAPDEPTLSDLARRTAELEEMLTKLGADVRLVRDRPMGAVDLKATGGNEDRLSLFVFSGSLDRLIASFVIATGAVSMGMDVHMFFTFWATAALRKERARVDKTFIERMFGWMLPRGSKRLPLSQLNLGGGGPAMIRHIMRKRGAASLEEMMAIAGEMGVKINVCTMSMDLLGMKEGEFIDYPGLSYCGVAKFLETAAPGKITMFV
jgi:peroxiredoxin family protein